MESVRDLNMDTDDMQVVLSAINSVSRRIKEVAETHKPLLVESIFSQVRRYANVCISVLARCRIIGTKGLYPTRSLLGRYYTKYQI